MLISRRQDTGLEPSSGAAPAGSDSTLARRRLRGEPYEGAPVLRLQPRASWTETADGVAKIERTTPSTLNIHHADRRSFHRQIEPWLIEQAAETLSAMQEGQQRMFRLGLRAAPLFFGYALFIAEQCRIDRPDKLLFFTREGELFHTVFEILRRAGLVSDERLPDVAILEVSRLATFSPSLRSLSVKELMRLWSLYTSQSMFALSRSLGIDPLSMQAACARQGIDLEEQILHPWQDSRVKQLLGDPELKHVLVDKIDGDRRAALAFLEAQGLGNDGATLAVVDIGWRGTIQDNVALMFPGSRFIGYYLGLQRFLNPQPPNCLKRAYGPNANRDLSFSHLLDAVSPMEMLCSSPNGSVMGYRFDDQGAPFAVRLTEPSEALIHEEIVRHFQEGVLFACERWAAAAELQEMRSAHLRETACGVWGDLITKPERQLSEAYARLNHNDVFGVGTFVDKKQVPSPLKMLRGLVSSKDRREVILYIKQTQWSSGLWHRRDLAFAHKAILVAALATGRAYKRARMWMQHHWLDRGKLTE